MNYSAYYKRVDVYPVIWTTILPTNDLSQMSEEECKEVIKSKWYNYNDPKCYRYAILPKGYLPSLANEGMSWYEITKEVPLVLWERSIEREGWFGKADYNLESLLAAAKKAQSAYNLYRFGLFPESIVPNFDDPRWKTWQELTGYQEEKIDVTEGMSQDLKKAYVSSIMQALQDKPDISKEITNMAAKKGYSIMVVFHPKPTRSATGDDTTPDSIILVPRKDVIASSREVANMIAAQSIPKDTDLSLCQIVTNELF